MPNVSLILPLHRPNIYVRRKEPFFYLAGPVLGGGDWHYNMIDLLSDKVGRCIVANPSNYRSAHPLHPLRLKETAESQTFERQKLWERHYMLHAAKVARRGALIFWLPAENKRKPRDDGNPYAMDTRGEIGEWRGRLMHDRDLRVIVGAEEGFPGLPQILFDFQDALGSEFEILTSMEAVANAAAELVRSTKKD